MLFLGLSVPGEVPRCSASVLVLLTGFLNSVDESVVVMLLNTKFFMVMFLM